MTEKEFPRTRFYLPTPYVGPPKLALHQLGGSFLEVPVALVSCFEEFQLALCLRKFVEVYLINGRTFVLQESRELIETFLADTRHEG